MCGCGRKKTQSVTSAQLAQQELDAAAAYNALADQMITQAESYAKSAANAITNAGERRARHTHNTL